MVPPGLKERRKLVLGSLTDHAASWKPRSHTVLLLRGMFSEQQSGTEYGKKLSLEIGKMGEGSQGRGCGIHINFIRVKGRLGPQVRRVLATRAEAAAEAVMERPLCPQALRGAAPSCCSSRAPKGRKRGHSWPKREVSSWSEVADHKCR